PAYLGDEQYSAAGTGADKATYAFSGLAAGQYAVSAHWATGTNRATNTPFGIFDNTTLLTTVLVNQQLVPNDETANGVGWKNLGTFTISSGTLKTVISDNANNYVIADAVRIVKQASAAL